MYNLKFLNHVIRRLVAPTLFARKETEPVHAHVYQNISVTPTAFASLNVLRTLIVNDQRRVSIKNVKTRVLEFAEIMQSAMSSITRQAALASLDIPEIPSQGVASYQNVKFAMGQMLFCLNMKFTLRTSPTYRPLSSNSLRSL